MANVFSSLPQNSSFMSPRPQVSSTKTMPMPAQSAPQQRSFSGDLNYAGAALNPIWDAGKRAFGMPQQSGLWDAAKGILNNSFGRAPVPAANAQFSAQGTTAQANGAPDGPAPLTAATNNGLLPGQQRFANGNISSPTGGGPATSPTGPGPQGSSSQGPVTISPTPNYAKGEGYTGNSPNAYQNTIQQPPNSGEGLYQQFVRQLANQNKNTELGQNAQDIGNRLGEEINKTKTAFGNMATGDLSTGTSPVAEGNAGLAYNNMSNRISALSEQAQQQLAGNSQALTAQGQQQGALNQATGYAAPQQYSPTATPYNPAEGTFGGGGQANRAFGGGQAGANVDIGAKYQGNKATLATLTGAEDGSGTGGSVGDFNSAMQSNGLNPTDIGVFNNIMNAWSNNTSGPNAMVQNQFTNLMKQYAKILGDQRITDLITSSSGSTMSNFINSLTRAAQQVQNGYYAAGTGGAGTGAPDGNSQSGGSGNDPLNLGI